MTLQEGMYVKEEITFQLHSEPFRKTNYMIAGYAPVLFILFILVMMIITGKPISWKYAVSLFLLMEFTANLAAYQVNESTVKISDSGFILSTSAPLMTKWNDIKSITIKQPKFLSGKNDEQCLLVKYEVRLLLGNITKRSFVLCGCPADIERFMSAISQYTSIRAAIEDD